MEVLYGMVHELFDDAAMNDLAAWEYRYNHQRFSMALNGRTPMEKLAAMLAPPVVTSSSATGVR